ncbi:hypothetical protein HD806DRAFT_24126 [Xylariaceae sp. AK1471]|nr:hypothetical protein HD806DRAFT_24126 [Xylariaceae sp. AK1471]
MRFSALFFGALAIARPTPSPRANSAESDAQECNASVEACTTVYYGIDIKNPVYDANPPSNFTDIPSNFTDVKLSYTNKDPIPYKELPPCHVKCWDSEAHKAMWVHDVRELSVEDFCWKKRVWTESWMIDHLINCVVKNCNGCGKACGQASQAWMHKYCHRP